MAFDRRTSQAFGQTPGESQHGARTRIDASARVTGSILWDDVEIGANATIDECIVTDGVHVPAGGAYHRAMLIIGDGGLVGTPLDL